MNPNRICNQTIVVANRNQMTANMDAETILFHAQNGAYYGLTGVAQRIWDMIQSPVPVGTILSRLTEEFEVPSEQCRDDVRKFLGEMLDENLVIICDEQVD